jgi:taurine--2-oxoglutarate transaminase
VREICNKHGILLISDEVMSGWGRTGKWFAVDNWNVVPDMITTAKGITSGYVPLGACIVSEPIAKHFDDKYLYAGLTYNGHALACAAALATIETYEQDHLIENAVKVGQHLGEALEEIKSRHNSVGDVRYIGLFSTIELVRNRTTKEILPAKVMGEINKTLREKGLFTFLMANNMGSMVFVVPPLCITGEQLDEGLAMIDDTLELADKAVV